jgi:hypothetical protein
MLVPVASYSRGMDERPYQVPQGLSNDWICGALVGGE